MTKRYEKFEGWMVGKTFQDDGGDIGVVTREFEYCDSCVWAEWGDFGEAWIDVGSLVFLDVDEGHAPEQENKPIPWQVGQVVWDLMDGRGVVHDVTDNRNPIGIKFDNGKSTHAYKDGSRLGAGGKRTLFFSEPKIEAELFPSKKKFVTTFKKGETVVAKRKDGSRTVVFYVDKETELSVESTGCGYQKALYNFYKIGEEVKWD